MNRVFVVTQGINPKPDRPWFVAERKANGSLRRVKSGYLLMTKTKEESEDNLLHWLWIHCTGVTERRDGGLTMEAWIERQGGRDYILKFGIPEYAFR